jgi:hypothetical protein
MPSAGAIPVAAATGTVANVISRPGPLYRVTSHASAGAVDTPRAADLLSLDPGTSVLVSGPAMANKRTLVVSLLAEAYVEGDAGLFVSTRKSAGAIRREFANLAGRRPDDRFAVVDCTGLETDGRSRMTRTAGGPGDLTGAGIGVTEFLKRFHGAGLSGRFGLHSVSTMTMYADLRRVFQFLHVVVGRLELAGFAGAVTLDDGVVDARERAVLSQLFDAVVEVRETDGAGGHDLRCRGADVGPREWTPFRP